LYELELGNAAERGYWKCSPDVRRRLAEAMKSLCGNPRAGKPLRGKYEGMYRVRVGAYRIIYQVFDGARKIIVLGIGPRGDIY